MRKELQDKLERYSGERYADNLDVTETGGESYYYPCYLNCRLCPYPGAKCGKEKQGDWKFDYDEIPADDFVVRVSEA